MTAHHSTMTAVPHLTGADNSVPGCFARLFCLILQWAALCSVGTYLLCGRCLYQYVYLRIIRK